MNIGYWFTFLRKNKGWCQSVSKTMPDCLNTCENNQSSSLPVRKHIPWEYYTGCLDELADGFELNELEKTVNISLACHSKWNVYSNMVCIKDRLWWRRQCALWSYALAACMRAWRAHFSYEDLSSRRSGHIVIASERFSCPCSILMKLHRKKYMFLRFSLFLGL